MKNLLIILLVVVGCTIGAEKIKTEKCLNIGITTICVKASEGFYTK